MNDTNVQAVVFQAMRPRVWYRTRDLVDVTGLSADQVRYALCHLSANKGGVVECHRNQGVNYLVWMTRQKTLGALAHE